MGDYHMTCGDGRASAASGLVGATRERAYLERHPPLSRDGEAEFFNSYEPGACPWCGSGSFKRDGHDRNGVQRYRCRSCGRSFTPATGTVFDTRHLPASEWAMFLPKLLGSESDAACARDHQRSSSTPPYWVAKLFLVLAGCQDGVTLSGRVWIDEAYWPVDKPERVARPDGSALRGLSRNKMCIGVGVDSHGSTLYASEGRGKTNRSRTEAAFGGHIARRFELVHDREPSHNVLVERLGLDSEAHDARECARLVDRDNPLDMVNQECNLLKKFLRSHSGFRVADLQGWLDVYWVSWNVGDDMDERVAWVLDRAMRCRKTLRYRDFFGGRAC
jgi:hypothetical protein